MSQPIALGTVLGGRYKVSASLLSTADHDHVLQGEDQILRRRVSILVPAPAHESTVVENARSLAAGSGHSGFQVLDMGQTEDATYLVTSYAPATDLLDALLFADQHSDDYSLSDDIFGDARTASSASYIYEEPDPTQPQRSVAPRTGEPQDEEPAVTRWSASDYDDYSSAPPAPSVRNRLGLARKVRPGAVRSTMFDRAASRGGSGGATVAAGAIDPTYDGDNRYESFERTEGKPDRLDERHGGSRAVPSGDAAGSPDAPGPLDDAAPAAASRDRAEGATAGSTARTDERTAGRATGRTTAGTADESTGETAGAGAAVAGTAGVGATLGGAAGADAALGGAAEAGAADQRSGQGLDPEPDPAGSDTASSPTSTATVGAAATGTGAGGAPGTDGSTAEDSRKGPLRWLLLLLLAIVLIAAIVLGFRGLGTLTSQFTSEGAPEQTAAPADPSGSPAATAAPSAAAAPDVASASRLTSDPNFMADTDATLNQATDGDPATYWLSYGFSSAQFGNLADSVGLAVQLKEPATAQELTIQQADGSGGQFTVYVSDQPSLEGAQEVGKGSFTGPEVTVPLADAARSTPHQYVLVQWTELPQLSNPIGGYPFGLRIGEVDVR
ncbi:MULTISPECIES: hypothetical protein [Kocuria]|uniref:hypothetical protein n=1 Tax=Kocuria TaxID=57493 RepID=UPI00075069C9|nr:MULTISPECIES: hypothetical protein [Kocuria]MXN61272.1 hypothetical protein [Bacillus sp. BGMRC0062]KUP27584.1 hypothetical protein IX41_06100 [Kocuria rhizophila]MCT1544773.1 hypothetical protein [Kocuria rhizophila]MCT2171063.1 hypothetical protein [Kocuria rhizophila]MDN3461422.1 hypothetical protein [Kocuria sp. APC 4018]